MTRKTKILGTGLTGLVGSRIVELLKDKYEFENLSLETGVDITDKETVAKKIVDTSAEIVLHLAAKTDVDSCEKDREKDTKILSGFHYAKFNSASSSEGIPKQVQNNGFVTVNSAWAINVEGTRNIVEAAKKNGKKIIYISTDFIFDGTRDFYEEEDNPNPINWYGVTKYEGEKIVQDSNVPSLICRLAFPYRANFPLKKDFVRGILERLKNGQEIKMVKDEIITPTFIDDISHALDLLISQETVGIYHVAGGSSHTPLEIAHLLAHLFNLDESLISETTREAYFAGRAPRPFSLKLKNDKLAKLGVKMSFLDEGLKKIKDQLITHNS